MKSQNILLPIMFKWSKPARKYLQGLVLISALFLLLTNKNSTEMATQLRKMAPNDYGMGNALIDRRLQKNELVKSECTLVTAYYHIHPARPSNFYEGFIENMMALRDPMVIFTSADNVEMIKRKRSHLPENRTAVIPLEFNDIVLSEKYPDMLTDEVLKRESKNRYGTVNRWRVIKVWHAKAWFVMKAMEMNVYDSKKFLWMDIGHFRHPGEKWKGRTLISHPEVIPDDRMLMQANKGFFTMPRRPPNAPWLRIDQHYVSGSAIAGHMNTWPKWYDQLQEVWKGMIERGMSLADDQHVYLNVCLQNRDLCLFTTLETKTNPDSDHPLDVPQEMDGEDMHEFHGGRKLWNYWGTSYFTFKFVLYHGADTSQFWHPYKDGDAELAPLDTEKDVHRGLYLMMERQNIVRQQIAKQNEEELFRSIDCIESVLSQEEMNALFGETVFRIYDNDILSIGQ